MLDDLVAQLETIDRVTKSTRKLWPTDRTQNFTGYVGIVDGDEVNIVEDSTHIRWELECALVCQRRGTDIQEMIDDIKDLIYGTLATDIGALQINYVGNTAPVELKDKLYEATTISINIVYVSSKSGF